jgi:thiaminase/transcriptional activator TenA
MALEKGPAPFSKIAWEVITPIIDQLLAHSFIRMLMKGTLPKETFLYYIEQDALYLDDFGKILAATALKNPHREEVKTLFEFVLDTINVKRELHKIYLTDSNKLLRQSPSSLLYTSFLYRHLTVSPLCVIMASLLPCYWIYMVVGHHILSLASQVEGNPYQDWIDTYGGEIYSVTVEKAIKMTDRLADEASSVLRLDMLEAFVTASTMELMFWNSAYRREEWSFKFTPPSPKNKA